MHSKSALTSSACFAARAEKSTEITIVHKSMPEPELFMPIAAKAMHEYHKQYGTYANEWSQLGIEFVCGPYYKTDPDIRPPAGSGNRWKPKNCHYTYQITQADNKSFLIQAFDESPDAAYSITEAMEKPEMINAKQLYLREEFSKSDKQILSDKIFLQIKNSHRCRLKNGTMIRLARYLI